jgi:hypothetical protein
MRNWGLRLYAKNNAKTSRTHHLFGKSHTKAPFVPEALSLITVLKNPQPQNLGISQWGAVV